MFILGHLGVGFQLSKPYFKKIEPLPILTGTLFPDILDKLLFYGVGRPFGVAWISGTRTIGHTCLLLMSVYLISLVYKNKKIASFAFGIATHLSLDLLLSYQSAASAVFFPYFGFQFPLYPFQGLSEHVSSILRPEILISELIGLILLIHNFNLFKKASN